MRGPFLSMPYLLDGNNLIGAARGTARPSREDREALVRELAERLRRTRAKAVLFFDGPASRALSLGGLSVRSCGGSADDGIVDAIGRSPAPQEILVVTADRDLARRARDAGARVLAPQAFWRSFGSSRLREEKKETAIDVKEWMDYFADERNRE